MIKIKINGKQNLIQKIINQKTFLKEVIDAKSNKVIIKSGQKTNFLQAKKLHNDGLKEIFVSSEYLRGKFLHKKLIY